MKKLHIILAAAILSVVVSVGVAVASPDGFSWYRVEKMVADMLFNRAEQSSAPELEESKDIGAAGDIYRTRRIESVVVTSATVTTSLQNTGNQPRIIDRVGYYVSTTIDNPTTTIEFYKSTDCVSRTTDLEVNGDISTTSPNWFTTSSFNTVRDRQWATSTCVSAVLGSGVTTSAGVFFIEYFVAQ